MKKIYILIGLMLAILLINGCGRTKEPSESVLSISVEQINKNPQQYRNKLVEVSGKIFVNEITYSGVQSEPGGREFEIILQSEDTSIALDIGTLTQDYEAFKDRYDQKQVNIKGRVLQEDGYNPFLEVEEVKIIEQKGVTSDSKSCNVNSDCAFKGGCYCGCYNKNYKNEKLESMFCSCESTSGGFPDCECKNNKCVATVKTTEITIGSPRGDEEEPGSIEEECQKELENYVGSIDFTNKGFTECKLIESKVGFGEEGCPGGFTPQGCAICKLECR